MNDRRLLKPLVRRPGGTDWEDISWDDAINEIATRVKRTRDETFVEKDAAGHTVNRLESLAWIGGLPQTNQIYFLGLKRMHPPRVVHFKKQARVLHRPPGSNFGPTVGSPGDNKGLVGI